VCGLAGIYNLNGEPVATRVLQAMTDAVAHRGPDGEGVFCDGSLGLGHRRLAILDLTPAGNQPMCTPDGRYVLTYNGEVYNFRELRAELQALGRQFYSRTDTEVVLNALATWGNDALSRFNGMFALAFWDRADRRLLLARDRYGIKPLYYAHVGEALLFGSEIKAILANPRYRAEMDTEALVEYFTFQNMFAERTLFRNVRILPAGSWLAAAEADREVSKPRRYWDFDFSEPTVGRSELEYLEELDRLFRQAISRQLVADVEVGSYLSGGTDSGSITAVAAAQIDDLKTFTVGFDLRSASGLELAFDERPRAEHMSYLFETEHYEMVLKAGDMERVMTRLVWHMEEPRVGQSYPNFYAAHLAAKFVSVVLSGAGGDELFGGYPWRYYRAVVNDDFEHYIDKYYAFWQRMLPNRMLKEVFQPIAQDIAEVRTREIFRDVFVERPTSLARPEDYINHSLYFEARTFLHGLLVVEDKLSMAHGLEARLPFLDNDLVDFAQRLPVSFKLGNLGEVVRLNENEPGIKTARYFERTTDGKVLLRKAMERYVPPAVARAQKQGFSGPDASWFRGESIAYVRRALLGRDAAIFEYLDRDTVHGLVEQHLSGEENRRLLIWSLLSVEEWCHVFLLGERPSASGSLRVS
jgi:asparagine synthase (glutamine-hydrolysing)